ncbi:MAG TPA: nuclear transport factor 2 family protein, partial [Myxococcaceae bacterium]|nr:nuclear transport factor 2 family protein [Myxococcaceae bacterium]
MRRTLLLMAGMLMFGCATTGPRAATQEEEVLLRTDREFNEATQARGVEGWVAFFSEDGAMLRPGGSITGHEAIRAD